jgi:hypothetical protein
MRKRYAWIALAALAPLLMAPTGGGFPSRPQFQSVGVGTTAPATSGDLRVTRIGVSVAPGGGNGTVLATQFLGPAPDGTRVFSFSGTSTGISSSGSDELDIQTTGGNRLSITSSGVTSNVNLSVNGNLSATGTLKRNGVDVCTSDGASCPAIPAVATFVKTSGTSRASTTTLTADPTLTTTTLTAGKIYALEALISWDQGGVTTNGIQVDFTANGTSAQTLGMVCHGSANTTSANIAPSGNSQYQNVGGPYSQTIGTAGLNENILCAATVDLTACASGCGVNVRWAQAASIATNTTVKAGSWMKLTRLN